jgi:hypothetical protein
MQGASAHRMHSAAFFFRMWGLTERTNRGSSSSGPVRRRSPTAGPRNALVFTIREAGEIIYTRRRLNAFSYDVKLAISHQWTRPTGSLGATFLRAWGILEAAHPNLIRRRPVGTPIDTPNVRALLRKQLFDSTNGRIGPTRIGRDAHLRRVGATVCLRENFHSNRAHSNRALDYRNLSDGLNVRCVAKSAETTDLTAQAASPAGRGGFGSRDAA